MAKAGPRHSQSRPGPLPSSHTPEHPSLLPRPQRLIVRGDFRLSLTCVHLEKPWRCLTYKWLTDGRLLDQLGDSLYQHHGGLQVVIEGGHVQCRLPDGPWSGGDRGIKISQRHTPPPLGRNPPSAGASAPSPSHRTLIPPRCRKSQFRSSRSFFRTHRSLSLAARSRGDSRILAEDERESGRDRMAERPRAQRKKDRVRLDRQWPHGMRSGMLQHCLLDSSSGSYRGKSLAQGPRGVASLPLPTGGRGTPGSAD